MSDQALARLESGIDKDKAAGMVMARRKDGGAQLVPSDAGQAMEMAKMMAVAKVGVRKHLRGNPGACLSVCLQAMEWGMNPFSVANKSYEVNDQIAYESQLIAAVLNTRAPIKGRLKYEYAGEGQHRKCTCTAALKGEDDGEEVSVTSPPIGQITPKNSPLWKNDPDQQLAYYTARALARRHFPEVLLGVYAEDELEVVGSGRLDGGRVVAGEAPERPKRSDYREGAIDARAEPAEGVDEPADPAPKYPLYDVWGDRQGEWPLIEAGGYLVDGLNDRIEKKPDDVLALIQMNAELLGELPPTAQEEIAGLKRQAQAVIEAANKRAEGGEPPKDAPDAAADDGPPAHFDDDAPPAEEAPAAPKTPAASKTGARPPEAKPKKEPAPGENGFNVDRWVRARLRELEGFRQSGDADGLSGYWQDVIEEVEAVEAEHPGDAKEVRTRHGEVQAAIDPNQAAMAV